MPARVVYVPPVLKSIICIRNLILLLLPLLGAFPSVCSAQLLERCDGKHISEERFHLPRMTSEDNASTVGLIGQLQSKTNWNQAMLDSGLVVQGTLAYPDGTKRGITFYFKGRRHLRIEEQAPTGLRVLVVNGNVATTMVNGQPSVLSLDTVLAEGVYLPFYSDITAPLSEVRFTASMSSTDNATPQSTTKFRSFHFSDGPLVTSEPAGPSPKFRYRMNGKTSESEIALDPNTLLPTEIKGCSPLPKNPNASRPVVRRFSSYVTQGGFTFPQHIEQKIGDSRLYVLDIASLQTGQSLSDKLWTLNAN